jgi:hypothetical protein
LYRPSLKCPLYPIGHENLFEEILNFEKTLFPALQEQLGVLSSKEEKLMRILELAQIELYVSEVKIT